MRPKAAHEPHTAVIEVSLNLDRDRRDIVVRTSTYLYLKFDKNLFDYLLKFT